jgi:ribose/xylose/arabinose/galactoside ABC-type transport system permease subunit
VTVILYTSLGLLVALAAIIYSSRVSSARGDAGLGLELDVIAAVVLGGASIYGGVGSIPGTLLGVFLIAFVRNGLLLANVASTWAEFVVGLILILAVFVNEFFRARTSPTGAVTA